MRPVGVGMQPAAAGLGPVEDGRIECITSVISLCFASEIRTLQKFEKKLGKKIGMLKKAIQFCQVSVFFHAGFYVAKIVYEVDFVGIVHIFLSNFLFFSLKPVMILLSKFCKSFRLCV